MTIDHERFEEAIVELDDLDALPDELGAHAAVCDACARRLGLIRRIRATARQSGLAEQAVANDGIDVAPVVLDAMHPTQSGRSRFLLAVAAVAVIAASAGLIVANRSGESPDVLADIADELRGSEGTRFVLATQATVDLVDEFDLAADGDTPVEPLSNQLPRCDGDESAPTPSAGADLSPIVDALSSDDPCRALALIADSVTEPVADTYSALSASISTTTQELDALNAAEPGSQLAAASAAAYRQQQEQQLAVAQDALQDLTNSFTSLTTTLEPLAESSFQSVSTDDVGNDLVALQARIDAADAAVIDSDSTVTWSQIGTGSWTPNQLDVSGTTERDGQDSTFANVDDDPLGLATVILATPERLLAILDSAPPSSDTIIEWELPQGLIDGPQRWTATAQQTDGQLDDLVLRSDSATITFTPAR